MSFEKNTIIQSILRLLLATVYIVFGTWGILKFNFNLTLKKPLKSFLIGFLLILQFIFTIFGQYFELLYLLKYVVLPLGLIFGFIICKVIMMELSVGVFILRFLLGYNIVAIWYKSLNRVYFTLDVISILIGLVFVFFNFLTINRLLTILILLAFSYLIIIGVNILLSMFIEYPIDWNIPVWECLLTYFATALGYHYQLRWLGGLGYFDEDDAIFNGERVPVLEGASEQSNNYQSSTIGDEDDGQIEQV